MSAAATVESAVTSANTTTTATTATPTPTSSIADEQKAGPGTAAAAATSAARPVDMSKYGIHDCTCDGCNAKPINGFRYKCSKCKDHDICESCHTTFLAGTLPHANKLNPMQSKDVSAHTFHAYVDGKSFKAIGGGKKSEPAVKKAKVKPNDPCTCNSGKKYKKCCGSVNL